MIEVAPSLIQPGLVWSHMKPFRLVTHERALVDETAAIIG